MMPVDMEEERWKQSVRHWLTLLEESGILTISFYEIVQQKKTIYWCNCRRYMQHMLCEQHTFCTMMVDGVVTAWPATMEPTPTLTKRDAGRPENIKGGKNPSLKKLRKTWSDDEDCPY
mmetsp:Transcript_5248/g.14751  ORF Transcript_5248/g.14751 Transcript_5248/m.14751 type:complete len:118 (+) Transcript_5248:800-1153(+)